MRSIRQKVVLVLALIMVLFAGGLTYIATHVAGEAVVLEVEKSLESLAAEGADLARSRLDGNFIYLEGLAGNGIIRDPGVSLEEKMKYLLEEVPGSGFLRIGVADPSGNLYLSDSYGLGGNVVDVSERSYYLDSMGGNRSLMPPALSVNADDQGKMVMVYSVPIVRDAKVEGVLVAVGEGAYLSTLVDGLGYGEKGYGYIIDPEGTVIGHKRRELVEEQYNPLETVKTDPSVEELAGLFTEILAGNQGIGSYFFNGQNVYAGYAQIPETPWKLVVVGEESEMLTGVTSLRNFMMLLALVMILLGSVVAFFFGSSFAGPIVDLKKVVDSLAGYDLQDSRVQPLEKYFRRRDEVGMVAKALKTMQGNLRDLVREISGQSQSVAAASEELTSISMESSRAAEEVARTIGEIARSSSEQARETENGAESISELGKSVEEDNGLLRIMNESVDEVGRLKEESTETMDQLIRKTAESREAMKSVRSIIEETNDGSRQIETASSMIRSIAEQTNLLALNAAIEAARAGEAGRGFAVVADEIRKLAEESNRFTDEIDKIIRSLTGKSADAVDSVREVESVVADQVDSVENTRSRFDGISAAVEVLKQNLENLNRSSQGILEKKGELVTMIQNLSAISEENAAGTEQASASVQEQTAGMEEIAGTSESLARLAQEMQEAVSRFSV